MIERNTYPDIRRRQIPGSDPVPNGYNGQFKVTRTGDATVSITWGSQPDSSTAGYIVVGEGTVSVNRDLSIGVSSTVFYISVRAFYSGSWQGSYVSSSTYPTQAATSETFLIATVISVGGVIQSVNQEHTGPCFVTRIP